MAASMSSVAKASKRKALIKLYGCTCVWCGTYMEKHDRTIEHMLPRSLGGTNALNNLRLAHWSCNHQRGANYDPAARRFH